MTIKSSQTLVAEALEKIKTISPDEAHKKFQDNQCNLIDIRDVRELQKEGRIEGANHIPRGMLEFWLDPESAYYKDGKLDGLSIKWYLNGNKSSEQIFSKGKLISAVGWKPNGERCPSTRVREGVGILVSYSDFGDESKRENFTNDEKKKVVEKYTNGKTREEGYYKNGRKDGLWIYYRLDGNENFRITYQEGKRINTEFP